MHARIRVRSCLQACIHARMYVWTCVSCAREWICFTIMFAFHLYGNLDCVGSEPYKCTNPCGTGSACVYSTATKLSSCSRMCLLYTNYFKATLFNNDCIRTLAITWQLWYRRRMCAHGPQWYVNALRTWADRPSDATSWRVFAADLLVCGRRAGNLARQLAS